MLFSGNFRETGVIFKSSIIEYNCLSVTVANYRNADKSKLWVD